MPHSASRSLYAGMTACMTESRHPHQPELEAVAAKIWREAFAPTRRLAWENVEVGSTCHRRVIAAARIALDPPAVLQWEPEAAPL